jgi:hypothetical protein
MVSIMRILAPMIPMFIAGLVPVAGVCGYVPPVRPQSRTRFGGWSAIPWQPATEWRSR